MGAMNWARATVRAFAEQADAVERAELSGHPNPGSAGWQGDTVGQVVRSAARAVRRHAGHDTD